MAMLLKTCRSWTIHITCFSVGMRSTSASNFARQRVHSYLRI
jgi:hypothetical protein